MTWLTRKIVDLFNALANLYYSRKYAAIAERMGLKESQVNAQKRGFIILQIDIWSFIRIQASGRNQPHFHELIYFKIEISPEIEPIRLIRNGSV